jgi:hypothetical protein
MAVIAQTVRASRLERPAGWWRHVPVWHVMRPEIGIVKRVRTLPLCLLACRMAARDGRRARVR